MKKIKEGDGDPRHGTHNGYGNLHCRCQPCKDANADWQWAARRRRAQKGVPAAIHGKYTTYFNWMCRCVDCKAAHNRYQLGLARRTKV